MATLPVERAAEVLGDPFDLEQPDEAGDGGRTDTADDTAPQKSRGFLLDAPEPEVAEWIEREVARRQKAMDRRMVWARACRAWRAGLRFVRVRERIDEAQVYIAPSTGREPPTPNKCDQLVRRTVATLMVDPPAPDCVPASGEEQDRDAAEFSTRALEHEQERMGYLAKHEDALDKSFTYGSAFEYFCVDPFGARQPVEVLANANAQTAEPDPRINPLTGMVEAPFVKRYVREDGTLTEVKGEAKQQWVPRIRMEVLTTPHVHFLPEYCEGVDDADGVIICYPTTLGELRGKFEQPDAPWSTDTLRQLANYRPAKYEDLLPRFMDRSTVSDSSRWKDGTPPDDQVCFPFLVYMAQSSTYPMGAYLLTVGKSLVLHRDEWKVTVTDQQGTERTDALPVPVAQVRNLDDHQDGDPYGTTVTKKLGQMDEMRALQIGAWLEFLDRFNHPREYLPLGSIVQPEDLNSRDGRPILYNAEAGKPEFEQVATFPAEAVNMLQFITAEMDAEANLTGAQGQTSANITSGYQQRQVIEQALVGLSGIKRNADSAFTRGSRIILSLMRFFTVSQRMGYVSEAGRYKEDEWTAAELGDTRDVKIRRGTSTMMAPSAKQALARDELEVGLKVQDPQAYVAYRRALASNADAAIGLQDDPIRMRVRGQIHEWEQGPDDATREAPMPEPPAPMLDEMTGQPVPPVDEMGQPLPPPVHPMTEAAHKLFAVLPIDGEPLNARVRHEELSAAMAGARFMKQPPEWQAGLVEAYEAARQAAGVQTLAEQAQAQQQAVQAQQQAKAQEEQQKTDAKMAAKVQEAELERGLREQDATLDAQRMRIEAAVKPPTGRAA